MGHFRLLDDQLVPHEPEDAAERERDEQVDVNSDAGALQSPAGVERKSRKEIIFEDSSVGYWMTRLGENHHHHQPTSWESDKTNTCASCVWGGVMMIARFMHER